MSRIHCTRSYLVIIVLLQAQCLVSSLRLKIAKGRTMESDKWLRKRNNDACSTVNKVDSATIPFQCGPTPWDRPPATTFESVTVTEGMDRALMAHVPGLGKTTIKDVLRKLKKHGCVCLPFGGSVRDQFLGKDALDIDADTPCELDKVVDICKRYWDAKYCKAPPKTAPMQIVHIGELSEGDGEEMDLANWNTTFFGKLTNLEYTTNSLGYYEDSANNRGIVVDLPGTGVEDTCNKWIRIPVPSDQWQDWYNGDSWKIVRYWKLRAKGYTAQNDELPKFIKKSMVEILSTTRGEKLFKKSYCKYALSGDISSKRKSCIVSSSVCKDRDELRDKYYALYEEVLGEFWKEKAKPLLDRLKIECPKPQ